jgi:uncharacterized protein YjiS (DUF1127 family)
MPTTPHDGLNSNAYEIRHFSCAERAELKAHLIARAHEERNRMLRQWAAGAGRILAAIWRGAREPGNAVRAIVRSQLARQRRLAELRQLAAMTDLELKDMGITRMEIRAAAQPGPSMPRYGLCAPSAIQTTEGEKHAESLLDRSRLGS